MREFQHGGGECCAGGGWYLRAEVIAEWKGPFTPGTEMKGKKIQVWVCDMCFLMCDKIRVARIEAS